MKQRGLQVACLAAYTNFTAGADRPEVPLREMQIRYVEELAELCRDLGGNLIRVFTGYEVEGIPYDQQWEWCVTALKECARRAARYEVGLAVQNHHDLASHHLRLLDLLRDIDEPNCQAAFDAWAPALQGVDLAEAVRALAGRIAHTTVADYVLRPRFRYLSRLVNFAAEQEVAIAVPVGEGMVDYQTFFAALRQVGYNGWVAYEMCSPLRGGGSEENLDCYAGRFLDYVKNREAEPIF